MASFPGAVKSFTTKNAGDTIQPAHVNDLQDEVAAIEDGYLNGTARLNSSASTLASLSVSGGSTFTGPLQSSNSTAQTLSVLGNSTFVGNVQINGNCTVSGLFTFVPNLQRVRVTHSASQDVPSGVWTALNFDTDTYNAFGMHSTSVNSSRITFAASSGTYAIGANVEWNASSGGVRILRLMKNDTTYLAGQYTEGAAAILLPQSLTTDVLITSTADYITLQVFQNAGSSRSISSGAGYGGAVLWAHKI